MLEFYSSSNGVVNSKRAVAECLENALGTDSLDCDLIIFYTTIGHSFEEILNELHRLSPNAQIVGCTGAGIIGREGPNETMRGLGIMAIRGPREEFAVAGVDSIIKMDSYEVGARIAQELKNKNPRISMIHFLPGALLILPAERAIAGIESVFGPDVPLFGGCSLDNTKWVSNFQFIGDRIIEQGAVAVGFADPTLEVVMRADHSYTVIGEPFEVTRSKSNRLFELDGNTAWKAMTERVGVPETVDPMANDAAALFAIARELPEELHEEYGSPYTVWLGSPLKGTDGSICTLTTCPVGTKLWLTNRDEEDIFKGVDRIVNQIFEQLDGKTPVAVFHADCSARGKRTFNRFLKEEVVSRMQIPLCRDENVPWLGFYAGGEICMIAGQNQFHGFTTSLFVLYRRGR
jgi:hypothetical protein